MSDGAATQTYSYDAANRLTGVTRGTDTFSYTYDLAGNLTRRTYPGGTITDYAYDSDNRLASVTSGGATTSYSYDPAGELTQTTLPSSNGYVETCTLSLQGSIRTLASGLDPAALSEFSQRAHRTAASRLTPRRVSRAPSKK